jgi:hypothetical protein
MTLSACRAIAAGVGLVLFGAVAGCGSGEQASSSPGASASPFRTESSPVEASPTEPSPIEAPRTEAPKPAVERDLSLRLVKANSGPPCTVYIIRAPSGPPDLGLPAIVVAFDVAGLPNGSGATVTVTSPPPGSNGGVLARFSADGSLREGTSVHLDKKSKVVYYAFPVDLRQIINKTVSFTLTVDPDNQVSEPNEKNNALKLRLTTRGVVGPPELTKYYPSGARNRCVKAS